MQLLKWWSQYLESRGEFEKARKTCTRAQDYLSLVRLACHGGQVERVRRNILANSVASFEVSSIAQISWEKSHAHQADKDSEPLFGVCRHPLRNDERAPEDLRFRSFRTNH